MAEPEQRGDRLSAIPTGATVQLGGRQSHHHRAVLLDVGIEDTKPRTTEHLKAAAVAALNGKEEGRRSDLESAGQIAGWRQAVIGAGDQASL